MPYCAKDEKEERKRIAAMYEAALHETFIHPNIVAIYSSVMQPMEEETSVGVGQCH